MEIKQFTAMKALIVHSGKILILRESSEYELPTNQGKYDVAGGRVDAGEHFMDALKREIKEETGLITTIEKPFYVDEWRPQINDDLQLHVIGMYFLCHAESDDVQLSKDHDKFLWISPEEHENYTVLPATRAAIEEYIKQRSTTN